LRGRGRPFIIRSKEKLGYKKPTKVRDQAQKKEIGLLAAVKMKGGDVNKDGDLKKAKKWVNFPGMAGTRGEGGRQEKRGGGGGLQTEKKIKKASGPHHRGKKRGGRMRTCAVRGNRGKRKRGSLWKEGRTLRTSREIKARDGKHWLRKGFGRWAFSRRDTREVRKKKTRGGHVATELYEGVRRVPKDKKSKGGKEDWWQKPREPNACTKPFWPVALHARDSTKPQKKKTRG